MLLEQRYESGYVRSAYAALFADDRSNHTEGLRGLGQYVALIQFGAFDDFRRARVRKATRTL
jgi:hypothetical protein